VGYSLPRCDLRLHVEYKYTNKYTMQRYKLSVFCNCFFVPTSFSWNSIHSVMRLVGVSTFVPIIVILWNHWQASKSLSWLTFEVFVCLCFRVTRRFMLRMQRELNRCTVNLRSSLYCASWHKNSSEVILSVVAHICLKWSHDKFGMRDLHSWL